MSSKREQKARRKVAAKAGWRTRRERIRARQEEQFRAITQEIHMREMRREARARLGAGVIAIGIELGIYPEGTLAVDGLPVIPASAWRAP